MAKETSEFWEGFRDALILLNIEVDKILATCYNDSRARDNLLDVKVSIKTLQKMTPDGNIEDMQLQRT